MRFMRVLSKNSAAFLHLQISFLQRLGKPRRKARMEIERRGHAKKLQA